MCPTIMNEKAKMQVNPSETGPVRSTACTSPPPATTSHDAATGHLTSPDDLSAFTGDYRVLTDACALNVPSADREPDSGWAWLRGLALALGIFAFVAAVFHFVPVLVEVLS